MIIAGLCLFQAFNFWTSNPTFNPWGVSRHLVGVVFFVIGMAHLLVVNLLRDMDRIRQTQIASLILMGVWGLSNCQQWLQGKASLQLPGLYVALAALHVAMRLESLVNLTTKKPE